MIAIGLVLLVLAAILVVVGALATLRRLPGNRLVGLRIAEVRASKEAWDLAHSVAGPIWLLSGFALIFGGIVALTASGWAWLIPALTAIFSVLAVSIGANLGARAAYLHTEANAVETGCGDSCNCGSGGCGDATDEARGAAGAPAPAAPTVDLGALRRAAQDADAR